MKPVEKPFAGGTWEFPPASVSALEVTIAPAAPQR
jgi:hypothetical protein